MPIKRFQLDKVRFTEGTRIHHKMLKNCEYLLYLDCDRLLYYFRKYANIDTKGAKGYGGWEGEWSAIKGEFLGHYMSACLNNYIYFQSYDDNLARQFEDRINYLVESLNECQEAIATLEDKENPEGFGYVAAIPSKQLDAVEKLVSIDGYDGGVPYYVHHKTLMGLVKTYNVLHNKKALDIAVNFTNYIYERLKDYDDAHMEKMLNSHRYPVQYFKEFGGMHEVLIDLYRITKDQSHIELAQKFDRKSFRQALVDNEDAMAHHMQHANSEIPCVTGLGSYYELTGDDTYKTGVLNFMDWMKKGHTFPTGGTSGPSVYPDYGGEFFHYPNNFYGHVTYSNPERHKDSGESCCAHNLNVISDMAFTWTGNISYAEEYEKRFINCVLSQQNDDTGMFLYHQNISQGTTKSFGTPDDSFWCCYCSGIEAFSSLQNGAFYYDDCDLWMNNFFDCTLTHKNLGLELRVETSYPNEGHMKLTFNLEDTKVMRFHVRIPSWATGKRHVKINGVSITDSIQSGTYLTLNRTFQDGDVVEIELEYTLYLERMPDRPEYVAIKYGPNMLVACTTPYATFTGTEEDLLASLKPTEIPCEFTTDLSSGNIIFKPLHLVKHEVYNGYTIISQPIEAIVTDCIAFQDKEAIKNHDFQGEHIKKGSFNNKLMVGSGTNGWLSFNMTIDPLEPMYLKCLYWGSEYGQFNNFTPTIRLFDIQVQQDNGEYVNISTQLLDHIEPNAWHSKIYPIPLQYTKGRQRINIRLKAKPFGAVDGVVGNLYENISVHHYGAIDK